MLLCWLCCGCRRAVAEWAVYFHLHTAESYTTEQDSVKAAEHADAAAELAQQQGLLEQQVTVQTVAACACCQALHVLRYF
jgi:hypothetical protein